MSVLTPEQEDHTELEVVLHLQRLLSAAGIKGCFFFFDGEAEGIQAPHLRYSFAPLL